MQEMLDKVLKTIQMNRLIEKGDTVLVAVSGGPDSVCLLHVLYCLSGKMDFKLHALHINHGLRGQESDADEAYTREICKSMGIDLHVLAFNIYETSIKRHMSLEEAGREVRYREFGLLADEIGASRIAVAHNMNDQAETILMNMIRGTGLQGLCGMDYIRDRIIRPLLDISRIEIENYCEKNGLNPRIDSSNLKGDFTRNKVRLELIPQINRSFGGDLTESLYRMSIIVRNENDFLEEAAAKAFEECLHESGKDYISLKIERLSMLHNAMLGRVLRIAIRKVKGDLKGLESGHVEDISALAFRGRTGTSIQLPEGIRAGVSYSFLNIYSDKSEHEKVYFDMPLTIPGFTNINEARLSVEASFVDKAFKVDKYYNMGYNSLVQFFDYDMLDRGINIRNRRNGDIFSPYGSGGTKKLKEYFIDKKIPRDAREKIPLVACGNEVVWIIGYRTSDKFKVTDNTKSVLKLEITEEKDTSLERFAEDVRRGK